MSNRFVKKRCFITELSLVKKKKEEKSIFLLLLLDSKKNNEINPHTKWQLKILLYFYEKKKNNPLSSEKWFYIFTQWKTVFQEKCDVNHPKDMIKFFKKVSRKKKICTCSHIFLCKHRHINSFSHTRTQYTSLHRNKLHTMHAPMFFFVFSFFFYNILILSPTLSAFTLKKSGNSLTPLWPRQSGKCQ